MRRYTQLDSAAAPDGTELTFFQTGADFLIRAGGKDLMSSRTHGSEQEMARIARSGAPAPRVLIGGLGMGWTVRAALGVLPAAGRITVVELIPKVLEWHLGAAGAPAGHPTLDPRVDVRIADVAGVLRSESERWDTILMDVDNGPEAFTQGANDDLYSASGLSRMRSALKPGGKVAIWSAFEAPDFSRRLEFVGLRAEVHRVRAHNGKGARHVIYVGVRK